MNINKYRHSVFVNCPFDKEYKPLFQAIIFTILDAGYIARCALEVADASRNRLDKIMCIVNECKYGIHDISRTEFDDINKLPRFNMPLELGIFLGCIRFGKKIHHEKSCLIFDKEKYRYQKFISDIAGQDVEAHNGRPETLIKKLRNWLRTETNDQHIPGGAFICDRFKEFKQDLPQLCNEMNIEIEELTYRDFVDFISQWLNNYDELIKEIASIQTLGIYQTQDGKEYDCYSIPGEKIAYAVGPLPSLGQIGARGVAFKVVAESKQEARRKLATKIGPGSWV